MAINREILDALRVLAKDPNPTLYDEIDDPKRRC